MIDFGSMTTTREELMLMAAILDRFEDIAQFNNRRLTRTRMDRMMDLEAAHAVCPLDLDALADATNGTLAHDVFGIFANLNRDTGELDNGFVPRLAR